MAPHEVAIMDNDGAALDARPRGRRRRRILVASVVGVGAIVLAWAGVIGAIGSSTLMFGDGKPHGCPTPATFGWDYEAVNYDRALDDRLPIDNPNWASDCPNTGRGTAGDVVVSADGTRLAAWYIPAGNGVGPTAPTVVIVHGWGVSKADALRYAATIHDRWNSLLIDTRYQGRSGGEWMSFGVRESEDLKAMLDWLDQAKHPSRIAVFGDSGGAAAAMKLARTDPRIAALWLESPHARLRVSLETEFAKDPRGSPVALTVPISMVAFRLRTGVWLEDADPIDAVADLDSRPLAIAYGTADARDIPALAALALYDEAVARGVPVELHACEGAGHGEVVNRCPIDYATWLNAFLDRTIGAG
jgi:pimeloyl-ACP methyl ester carboxylesterase